MSNILEDDFFDLAKEANLYKQNINLLLKDIMDTCKSYNQHHIKLDFNIVPPDSKFVETYRTIYGDVLIRNYGVYGGVHPIFAPYVYTYNSGIYAISKHKQNTVYIGANEYDNQRNNVYDRIIRFGKAIYNRMHTTETHPAGTRYRSIYGEDTSDLYLSFLFYDQFSPVSKKLMRELNLKYNHIEHLMIKKFTSQYLLNMIGK